MTHLNSLDELEAHLHEMMPDVFGRAMLCATLASRLNREPELLRGLSLDELARLALWPDDADWERC